MFKATDTEWASWFVVRSDDKRRARLNVISHLLGRVPYEELRREKPVLPKRGRPTVMSTRNTHSNIFRSPTGRRRDRARLARALSGSSP